MLLYAFTIVVSAFLLFQVQPVIAKIILPWFGGSAAVWTVCLLFFQMVLLLGYLYAHTVVRYLKPRAQTLLHIALLLSSILALPIYPNIAFKPQGGADPTIGILTLLAATVGLPYFLLSRLRRRGYQDHGRRGRYPVGLARQLVHGQSGLAHHDDRAGQPGSRVARASSSTNLTPAAPSVVVRGPPPRSTPSSRRARGSSGADATPPTRVPSFQITGRVSSRDHGSSTTSPWFQDGVR